MNDLIRTGIYSGTAFILAGVAVLILWTTRPRSDVGFEKVDQPFFETFDPREATSLTISSIDPDTDELQKFEVVFDNQTWVIPTHFDYPAEAADRLANVTTALMGVKRDALQGRLANQQKQYKVVDPLLAEDPTHTEPVIAKEAGTRVTIKNKNDEVLVDLIIGDPVKNEANGNAMATDYYARRPNEQQTYRVAADIRLSTRFADWINPDLLKVAETDFRRLQLHNYSIKDRPMRTRDGEIVVGKAMVPGDTFKFVRADQQEKWRMEGVDLSSESLNIGKVDSIVSILDQMSIVGVRPKQQLANGKYLINPDLTLNIEALRDLAKGASDDQLKQLIERISTAAAEDLGEQGFYLNSAPDVDADNRVFAQQGKVDATTVNGVKYTIYFGDVVLGETKAIEIGQGKLERVDDTKNGKESAEKKPDSKDPTDSKKNVDPKKSKGPGDDLANGDSGNQPNLSKSRFVMIRVSFDDTVFGEYPVKPAEPKKPEKPEGFVPTDDPKKPPADQKSDDQKGKNQDETKQDPPLPPLTAEQKNRFAKYEADLAQFEQDQTAYQAATAKYVQELNDLVLKTKAGKEKVDQLNERFGPWYYVVAADELGNLRLPRSELVLPIPDPSAPKALPKVPDISFENPPKRLGDKKDVGKKDAGNKKKPTSKLPKGNPDSKKSGKK